MLHYEPTDSTARINSSATNSNSDVTTATATGLDLGVRCLDWCIGRFEAPTMVVGGSIGTVAIYRYLDLSRSWQLDLQLDSPSLPMVYDGEFWMLHGHPMLDGVVITLLLVHEMEYPGLHN